MFIGGIVHHNSSNIKQYHSNPSTYDYMANTYIEHEGS